MARLESIIGKAISGEWGEDDENGTGIPVLRTTNFTNDGVINYTNVVTRIITKDNLSVKYLRPGDIIIEKSGGSGKQPVGRVVYYDGPDNTYLFNNFTGVLRIIDTDQWDSKYLFYALFANYQRGGTRKYQNKTTGLHNLKTDQYVKEVEIPERLYNEQKHIAHILDKVCNLIALRKQQLDKLDELVKARFVEMFGDIIHNNMNWPTFLLSDVANSRLGKMLDAKQQTGQYRFPYLANFNVQWFRFEIAELNKMDFNEADQKEFELKDGDLLVCEGGEVGRCAVWHDQVVPCYFQKALHRIRCNSEIIEPNYLSWWFKFHSEYNQFEDVVGSKATIAHLPGAKLKKLEVVIPPVELQRQFSSVVAQVDKCRLTTKQGLDKLEMMNKALMQRYFG